jgi:ElaB/YqjD/DUF883 family membrane-anchored ribosome-binding protein
LSESVDEGRDAEGLLDRNGQPLADDLCGRAQQYIREQPITAALIMLGVGFVIGRFRRLI